MLEVETPFERQKLMEKIHKTVEKIIADIEKNKYGLTYRQYETFFGTMGMLKRRNFNTLQYVDELLKTRHIALWHGKEQLQSLLACKKSETITFRFENEIFKRNNAPSTTTEIPKMQLQDKNAKFHAGSETAKIEFAGTIHIADYESNIRLYPHQKEAFDSLQQKIIKTIKNSFAGLLVLPTGGGKTLTAAHWLSVNILDKNKKILWIAHRHELLDQAQKTFASKLAFRDIFKDRKCFNYRILSGIHDKPVHVKSADDIIFASKDSLNVGFDHLLKNWIKHNEKEVFLVIDEAHHATAKTYRKLIDNLRNNVSQFRMLGLTATPFRTSDDEKGLLKKVFPDDIVYKTDLRTLIRVGILSEPHFEEVETGQDIIGQYELNEKQIKELNEKFGDFNAILGENISKTIAENKERNSTIVERYLSQKEKYGQTLVFALNIDNAIALNALFRERNIKSAYVISNVKDTVTGVSQNFTKENKIKIDDFRQGKIEVLINVNILTEGTDIPNVQSVFLTRPTTSNILMTQMIGRGLRGLRAGGTQKAYIVAFIDDWQNRVEWVNPEKLFIEENVDFNDKDVEYNKHLVRLVAIGKIEEFAILNDRIIEPETKKEIEKLNFIERIPTGIYQFIMEDRNCEILVYNNMLQSYTEFIKDLPELFSKYNLKNREYLTDKELDYYSQLVDVEYFRGCLKYPAYRLNDIRDVLQYYAINGIVPSFIELKEREKYDIDRIAKDIIDNDLGRQAREKQLETIWNNEETALRTFFNYDEKTFRREVMLAEERISRPDLYARQPVVPHDEKELRELEKMSLHDLGQYNPQYEKWLRDEVFKKYTDSTGYYYSAESGYRSKHKLFFQIDHIVPVHEGGLTVLDNLQLLTRSENAEKGIKMRNLL